MTNERTLVQQHAASLRNVANKLRRLATRGLCLGDDDGHEELQRFAARCLIKAKEHEAQQAAMAKRPKRGVSTSAGASP